MHIEWLADHPCGLLYRSRYVVEKAALSKQRFHLVTLTREHRYIYARSGLLESRFCPQYGTRLFVFGAFRTSCILPVSDRKSMIKSSPVGNYRLLPASNGPSSTVPAHQRPTLHIFTPSIINRPPVTSSPAQPNTSVTLRYSSLLSR